MKANKTIIFIVLAAVLSSCCTSQRTAERRIKRFVKCNPALLDAMRDTVVLRYSDTVIVEPASFDTTGFVVMNDTTTFNDDGITVDVFIPSGVEVSKTGESSSDTTKTTSTDKIPIYIRANVDPDTVIVERIVKQPCPDINIKPDETSEIRMKWFIFGVVGGLFMFALFGYAIGKIGLLFRK